MNTIAGCVLLGICTVVVLPPALATLLGWNPPLPHRNTGCPRLLASAVVTAYTAVLVEAAPRLADAPHIVVTVCSYSALTLALTAAALGITYDRAPGPCACRHG